MSEIIKNMIQPISNKDLDSIKRKFKSDHNRALVVELNGINIQSWKDYITEVQNNFRFPTPCLDSVDRYLDWMRDLEWLEEEEFVLIINHFSDFCKEDPETKKEIILDFQDIILPFWQDEVKDVVVGGETKTFMVYLVE